MPNVCLSPPLMTAGRSVLGKKWVRPSVDDRHVAAMARAAQLPEITARLLVQRGVPIDSVDAFLRPTLRSFLPDPFHLKDMDKAAQRLAEAVIRQEKIAVFADYDVDGATSSALFLRYMRQLGLLVRLYVPDRQQEGYGPNTKAFERLKGEGCTLCVIVDCGTTAFQPLQEARQMGLDVIVLDHHTAEPRLPDAVAIVNPNRLDENSKYRQIAAVAVTFLTVVAINTTLRKQGYFHHRPEPDLIQYLDLVAVGTVCDVMPLTDLNRAFVAQGLKVLAQRRNVGLATLADQVRVDQVLDAYHLGFILGPRINAGGRVGQCDFGARLLATDDPVEARVLVAGLEESNTERKTLEGAVLEEALLQASRCIERDEPHILVAGDGWHSGVIGIVASRLKEKFGRPASVVAWDTVGMGKGSGRSVKGVDLGGAIIAAKQAGLIDVGGGHSMAAGFSVQRSKIDSFNAFIIQHISRQQPESFLEESFMVDGVLTVSGALGNMTDMMGLLSPFGAGNPEPCMALADARIVRSDVVGDQHVRCVMVGDDGQRLKGIAFRAVGSPLGDFLLSPPKKPVCIAGHLRKDRFQNQNSVQMFIQDAALELLF